jgi:uncharacterized repeat protein (TIGR01451 family)
LTEILDGKRDVDAVHIVSHGRDGAVRLGNVTLSAENLDEYADQIGGWRDALKPTSDVLFYGCHLASSAAGKQFVDDLQELIGVDVAASIDTTGDFQRGFNWDLEYQTGPIEAQNPFSQDVIQNWSGTLDTRNFAAGSYVIDMGQPQTIGNAMRPYGLVYDLVTNHQIPVSWAIAPNKDWAFVSDALLTDTVGNIVDFTAWADTDWNPSTPAISKDYSGGSFVIDAALVTPAILSSINTWRAQGVVVDPITASFTADVYGDITSFPRAVLDLKNGGIVTGYYTNAGVPAASYRLDNPTGLNSCDDVYIIPHADPHAWPLLWRTTLNDFIVNEGGGMWAACHSPSSFESFGGLIPNDGVNPSMNYLSTDGLIPWGSHANGSPPYQYNELSNAADDPMMQIMNRLDAATQNGSEQIYIPQTTWRPTTTVAVYDPTQANRTTNDPYEAAAVVVYGNAFGLPNAGPVMYEAGHSHAKGTGLPNIAAQRAYFNFVLYNGIRRAPNISATIPAIVAGEVATLTATIDGVASSGTYQWISYNGSTFSQPTGTWNTGDEITTDFLLTVPNDTIKLLVTDSCGRRSVYAVQVSDTPPDLTGLFVGCFQGNGVAVPAIGNVTVTDGGTTLASAAIRLVNRPDGANETLIINQTLAASYGIAVSSDGAGGFNLTGTATHAQYEEVLETLQYINTLANPTLVNRSITVTVNDGVSDSDPLSLTLTPPTVGAFTNGPGGSPVTTYFENGTIYLRINDQTANTNPAVAESFTVMLTNAGVDVENVTLTETGPNTGIFQGSIASTTATTTFLDGAITATAGDTLTTSHTSACNTWIGSVDIIAATFSRKELYFTPDQAMDRVNPVTTNDTTTVTSEILGGVTMATVSLDTSTGREADTQNLAFSYTTTTTGTNTFMLVGVSTKDKSVSSITYNGVPLTLVGFDTSVDNKARIEIWGLVAPAGGANNLAISMSAKAKMAVGVATFTGVDQVNPLGTLVTADGKSNTASIVVSSAPGELVFDAVTFENDKTLTVGPGQTQLWNEKRGEIRGGGSTEPGAASVTMSWTYQESNREWVIGAVPIKPAANPGVASTTFTQTPPFATDFDILSVAPVVVTAYIQVTGGTFVNPPNIDAALHVGPTPLLSMTGAPTVTTIDAGLGFYKLEWSGTLPSTATVAAGSALSATLTTNESFSFTILHDSTFFPSRISLPTNDVITLDSLEVYDAQSPGGSLITSIPTVGTPVYVRATASDPFGAYDITSLDAVIKNANGTTVFSTTLGDGAVISSTTASKTYEFAWTPASAGQFTIATTANEGFGDNISASQEIPFDVAADPDVIITKSDGGVSVDAGQTVVYTLTYQNIGVGAASGVTITETLPANATFNAASSSPGWDDASSPTITYTLPGGIPAGGTGTVQFAVTVNATLPAGVTQLTNNVLIAAANEPLANQGNNTASDTTPVNAAPDLVVTKTDSGATVVPGGSVTYTLNYSNDGTQDATGVVITETLPPNTTIDPASLAANGGPWTPIGGMQYQATIGNLAVGASGTVSITIVLNAPVPDALDLITNTATIADDGTNGPDLTPGDNTATDTTPVDAAPNLYVNKTDGGMETIPGGIILYTITYGNTGTQGARQVALTEFLPANTTFDPVNSIGDWDDVGGGEYFLLIGDVPVGATGTATFAVIVDPLFVGTEIDNTVVIADDGSNGPDPDLSDNTATETTLIEPDPEADLQITKTNGVSEVVAGDPVVYTIVVTNAGPDPVTGATVSDIFSAALTGISWTSSVTAGTASGNTAAGTGNINDTVDLDVGGEITYIVTATVDASASGHLLNLASVTKADLVDPDLSNNVAIDDDPIIRISDLSVTKGYLLTVDADSSGNVTAGDTVRFTVTVSNAGPHDASGVVVRDQLPTGFTYLSDNAAANGQTYSQGTGDWNVGDLANGASATLQITALVAAGGDFTNVAQVWASDSEDPVPGNNSDSVTVPVQPVADLSLNKLLSSYTDVDGSGNLSGGDSVTFTLNLFNAGPNQATGVIVRDQLPPGYSYSSHTGPGTYDSGTGFWTVGTLNVLQTQTLTLTATVNLGFDPAAGDYTNYAQVWASDAFDPDSTPGDNSTDQDDDAFVTPLISDLSLNKSLAMAPGGDLDGSGGFSHGDIVRFTLTVANAGPDLATGVVVRDVLPLGFNYQSNDGGASYDGGTRTLTWSPGGVSVGTPRVLIVTATFVGGQNPATDYSNYAQVWASDNFDPDSTPGNNSTNEDDDDATAGLPLANLSLVKTAVLAPGGDIAPFGVFNADDTVRFTLTVANAGPDPATNFSVQDLLPNGLGTPTNISFGGVFNPISRTLDWAGLSLPVGDTVLLTFDALLLSSGSTTNYAQIMSSAELDPDSTPGNNSTTEDDDDTLTIVLTTSAPPVAVNDLSPNNPPGPVTLNVTDNDTDADGNLDPSTVDLNPSQAGQQTTLIVPGEGTWTVDGSGNVTFTPQSGFTNDPTPIFYTVTDTTGLVSNSALITVDYAPVATDDASIGNPTGTPVTVPVLANDTTGDAVDPTTVQIVGTANPGDSLVVGGQGTWSVDPVTGAITFTPESGFGGDPAPIQYTVQDEEGNTSNPAT